VAVKYLGAVWEDLSQNSFTGEAKGGEAKKIGFT
jgi:hypothetical protein